MLQLLLRMCFMLKWAGATHLLLAFWELSQTQGSCQVLLQAQVANVCPAKAAKEPAGEALCSSAPPEML
jgi:hypothetical protein